MLYLNLMTGCGLGLYVRDQTISSLRVTYKSGRHHLELHNLGIATAF